MQSREEQGGFPPMGVIVNAARYHDLQQERLELQRKMARDKARYERKYQLETSKIRNKKVADAEYRLLRANRLQNAVVLIMVVCMLFGAMMVFLDDVFDKF